MTEEKHNSDNPIMRLFASIAARYDCMNRVMSLGLDIAWRRSSIRDISMPDECRILDLACGTGDFTAELVRRWPEAEIDAVDITPEMLAIARSKIADEKSIRFLQGDAQNLRPLQSNAYSLIVCAFGFRNFPQKGKALLECRRLLAKGGKLVVLELFRPKSKFIGTLVNVWLAIVSRIFASGTVKEYRYLRSSVKNTVSADEFISMAEKSGFAVCGRRFLPPAASCLAFKAIAWQPQLAE